MEGRPRRIAIVEDHRRYRLLLREVIEAMPHLDVAWEAPTGRAALDLAADSEVEIAVVDLSLPDISGAEVVESLCARDPPIICVVVSGHTEKSIVERAMGAGAAAYVVKGRPADLRNGINAALDGQPFRSPPLDGHPSTSAP